MIIKDLEFKGLKYKIAYPNGFSKKGKYPVLFFFHGAGERGDDLEKIYVHGIFKEIKKGKEFPFIAVAPLCKEGEVWYDELSTVKKFILKVINNKYIDNNKIYISGISMGGYMSWQLLMSLAGTFTAGVICCGGGMYWNAGVIKVPLLVFHGDIDTLVNVKSSELMVNAINENGGNAKLTVYEGVAHDSWTRTFENEEIYKWLLSQSK